MTIAELEQIREFVLLLMVGGIAIAVVWILCALGVRTLFNYQDRQRALAQARQMKVYNTNNYIWEDAHDRR